jgi:HEAT repeat protein
VEICYRLETEDAVPHARKWLKAEDPDIQCWAAMILLRHGNKTKPEGLAEIEALLASEDGYPRYKHYNQAVEALLATKNELAITLACGILKTKDARPRTILQLLLAGRKECLDFLLAKLDTEVGDMTEDMVASWKQGDFAERLSLDVAEPDLEDMPGTEDEELAAARRTKRKELKAWLQEQFALIKAGKKSDVKLPLEPWDKSGGFRIIEP